MASAFIKRDVLRRNEIKEAFAQVLKDTRKYMCVIEDYNMGE